MSLLDDLKTKTELAADTAILSEIRRFDLRNATNNPALIAQAIGTPEYASLIEQAVRNAGGPLAPDDLLYDHLLACLGAAILSMIPGKLSTQIDPQTTYDTNKILHRARRVISIFEQAGIDRNRVLIKIPGSWEGIVAAKILEKEGIACNITLIFSLVQAVAAFDAKATMIAPYVGRITDWFKVHPSATISEKNDPGVASVQKILHYAKQFGHPTQVMAASFRTTDQIVSLIQCDCLTIGPKLLDALSAESSKNLVPKTASTPPMFPLSIDCTSFAELLSHDEMASTLFADGLKKFIADYLEIVKNLRQV